jgi:hypothetical protein
LPIKFYLFKTKFMIYKIKFPILLFLIVTSNILFAQFTKDFKLKLSLGVYGVTPPTNEYIKEFGFSKTFNYSFGLEKDFKLNRAGNFLFRSELLYNRTNIKAGFSELQDQYKLDHLLLPIKLVYYKNRFSAFAGLINNFNFNTQYKEHGSEYFEQVGTNDYGRSQIGNTYVDRIFSIQYAVGIAISGSKGTSFGIEFIDYFGYKKYYSKYLNQYYRFNYTQISSSALNFYMTFNLNRSQKDDTY